MDDFYHGFVDGQNVLERSIPDMYVKKSPDTVGSSIIDWRIERIVNFDFASGDLCKDGFVHFGFHDRDGKQ
jgi:hypothetical protein